jgi:DegV family protein with EDD domain
MQIIADRGADIPDSIIKKYNIKFAPLYITLDGNTYSSGIDIDAKRFYEILGSTNAMPTTSMPSPGDFASLFKEIATEDPDIFYIHISSNLSGTSRAAKQGAEMVENANIQFFDSKTLSAPYGWQVEAAAKSFADGWTFKEVKNYLKTIRLFANGMFTLNEMKYLVHGGRISHIKGLLATALQLKPIIKVDKGTGRYIDAGRGRTIKGAIRQIAVLMEKMYGEGARLRVQLLHGDFPKGLEMLKEELAQHVEAIYEETLHIAPVLGAHTGPTMIGLSAAPMSIFENPVKESTAEKFLDMLKLPGFNIPLLQESDKVI